LTSFQSFTYDKYTQVPGDHDWNPFGFRTGPTYCDISAHLPFLEFLAHFCDHITEFGTRHCFSTAAFINGCKRGGKVISYDLRATRDMEYLSTIDIPCLWEYRLCDTADEELEIEETDLLFIDTLHTEKQVRAELRQAYRVKRWICFHDTFSQGKESQDETGQRGILYAIEDFIYKNPEWKMVYSVPFNHGLMLIEKNGG
jgi:hypothetical protein